MKHARTFPREWNEDECCVPCSAAEEVDGRVDLQETRSAASCDRSGFRAHHRWSLH